MLTLQGENLSRQIESFDGFRVEGKLRLSENGFLSTLPASPGDQCEIVTDGRHAIPAEVVRVLNGMVNILPYERIEEIRSGMRVVQQQWTRRVPVGPGVLGRILDGLGRPLDGKGPLKNVRLHTVNSRPPAAIDRTRIRERMTTGQKAIDGLLTCGRGQRMGIFSGSGIGKSTLLGQIARSSDADINIISLVGERGCELRPFLEDCLGPEGLKRSIVVISTSDQEPLMRKRSVETAIAIADFYRDQGSNVLFLLDSLTRLAMAQRELGLALGEPPSSRGYTPSVFQLMARSLEQLGNSSHGSITSFVTVLVDADDLEEPISDAARALLDGHIVLSRRLAEREHYPAIDIARSISRVVQEVTDDAHRSAVRNVRAIMSTYAEVEDLIRIGTYRPGTNRQIDRVIELMPRVTELLRQERNVFFPFEETRRVMDLISAAWPN